VEVFYGIASSAEVAYYTYIYAKVKRDNFKKVTSYVHTAIIIGNLVAALSAQTLISTELLDIRQLTFITLGSCIAALILALFLPHVQQSIYFHNTTTAEGDEETQNQHKRNGSLIPETPVVNGGQMKAGRGRRFREACQGLLADFKHAYSNSHVLKWSVWWALAAAGNQMIRNYVQALWEAVADGADTSSYNGTIDAAHTFLSKFPLVVSLRSQLWWCYLKVHFLPLGLVTWGSSGPSMGSLSWAGCAAFKRGSWSGWLSRTHCSLPTSATFSSECLSKLWLPWPGSKIFVSLALPQIDK